MSHQSRRMTPSSWLCIVLALAGLAACSNNDGQTSDQATAAYSPPAWMAQQAALDEELYQAQQTCLTDAGYTFTLLGDGGFEFPEGTPDAPAALSRCTRDIVGESYDRQPTADQLRQLYERQLDVRACLVHEGYEIEPPVTEDTYVDGGGDWSPYDEIGAQLASHGEDGVAAEQARLRSTCPEPGLRGL